MRKALLIVPLVVWAATAVAADNSFFRILASKPNATFEDGAKCAAMLADIPASGDFTELKARLAAKNIIPEKWLEDKAGGERLTKGVMAYMICTSLHIRGGLMMNLLGPTRRYAFRECIYLKLVARGNAKGLVTGGELLAVLGRAEKYKRLHAKKAGETEE